MHAPTLARAMSTGTCQVEGAGHKKGQPIDKCSSCQWWLTSSNPKAVAKRASAQNALAIHKERGTALDGKLFLQTFRENNEARKAAREADAAIESEMVVMSDDEAREFALFQAWRALQK
jgi:hypothetical protein